jgi:hypothetical protein
MLSGYLKGRSHPEPERFKSAAMLTCSVPSPYIDMLTGKYHNDAYGFYENIDDSDVPFQDSIEVKNERGYISTIRRKDFYKDMTGLDNPSPTDMMDYDLQNKSMKYPPTTLKAAENALVVLLHSAKVGDIIRYGSSLWYKRLKPETYMNITKITPTVFENFQQLSTMTVVKQYYKDSMMILPEYTYPHSSTLKDGDKYIEMNRYNNRGSSIRHRISRKDYESRIHFPITNNRGLYYGNNYIFPYQFCNKLVDPFTYFRIYLPIFAQMDANRSGIYAMLTNKSKFLQLIKDDILENVTDNPQIWRQFFSDTKSDTQMLAIFGGYNAEWPPGSEESQTQNSDVTLYRPDPAPVQKPANCEGIALVEIRFKYGKSQGDRMTYTFQQGSEMQDSCILSEFHEQNKKFKKGMPMVMY